MQAIAQTWSRWWNEQQDVAETVPFRRTKWGWMVSGLNLLMALNSTYFFLARMHAGVDGWLMMNSCAPSILLFLVGFAAASPLVMAAGATMMFRYGVLGLVVFGWQGPNLFAQAGHIAMTLAVVYTVNWVVRHRRWRLLILGIGLGLLVLIPYSIAQHYYFEARPELLQQLLEGNLVLPE